MPVECMWPSACVLLPFVACLNCLRNRPNLGLNVLYLLIYIAPLTVVAIHNNALSAKTPAVEKGFEEGGGGRRKKSYRVVIGREEPGWMAFHRESPMVAKDLVWSIVVL